MYYSFIWTKLGIGFGGMIVTMPLYDYIYAQGSIVEHHDNGEVTIEVTGKRVRGFPLSNKRQDDSSGTTVSHEDRS